MDRENIGQGFQTTEGLAKCSHGVPIGELSGQKGIRPDH